MKKYINDNFIYFIMFSVIIFDIIMFYVVMKVFNVFEKELIAALIGFIGSIIGGIITFLGVDVTLKHRDREVFLSSATEKLMIIDDLINTYKVYLNAVFLLEHANIENDDKTNKTLSIVGKMLKRLNADNDKIYKCMGYDSIKLINFHKNILNGLSLKKILSPVEIDKCIEKVRDIFDVISKNKEKLEENYYKYKKVN